MAFMVSAGSSGPRELPPLGTHQAVCSHVCDLGIHMEAWPGKPPTRKRKAAVIWELAARRSDGDPFTVSKTYAATLGDGSNLRADLESWLGRRLSDKENVDLDSLAGMNSLLTLAAGTKLNGDPKVVVNSIMPLAAGMVPIKASGIEPPHWVAEEQAKAVDAPQPPQAAPAVVQGQAGPSGGAVSRPLPNGLIKAL